MYVRHSIAEQRARGWGRLRRYKATLPIFAHFPMRGCCSNRVNPHRPTRNDKSAPTARVLCAGPVNFIHTPYVLQTVFLKESKKRIHEDPRIRLGYVSDMRKSTFSHFCYNPDFICKTKIYKSAGMLVCVVHFFVCTTPASYLGVSKADPGISAGYGAAKQQKSNAKEGGGKRRKKGGGNRGGVSRLESPDIQIADLSFIGE